MRVIRLNTVPVFVDGGGAPRLRDLFRLFAEPASNSESEEDA